MGAATSAGWKAELPDGLSQMINVGLSATVSTMTAVWLMEK